MQNIELSELPRTRERGRIRRKAGRHRATGPKPVPTDLNPPADAARPGKVSPRPVMPPVDPSRPRVLRLPDSPELDRLDSIVTAYHQMLLERVDQGIQHLQAAATQLMGEVASEVWKGAGPDAGEGMGDRVITMLARDDSVRGLISHSDERYHALDVRLQRMEAGLRMIADTMKQSHLSLVADMDHVRKSVSTGISRSSEQSERLAASLAAQVDSTGRRIHSRLVHAAERLESQNAHIAARVEQTPMAAHLDGTLGAMTEQLQSVERAVSTVPDLTARRVATVTGMMSDQVEAAANALVRRIAQVSDAAVQRVVAATDAAAGRAMTTTEAIAARVAARTEAVAGRALRATEELAAKMADTTDETAERALAASEQLAARMEATSEALVNRFDAMGRVLVRAAARESEAIQGLDKALAEMREGLEDMGDSLDSIKRDVNGRALSLVTDEGEDGSDAPDDLSSIDEGFYGPTVRRRRRLAAG